MWGGRGATARPRGAERSGGLVRFFHRFSFFAEFFYLEFSVGEAISLSFDSFSILTEVFNLYAFFLPFFRFFGKKNILILALIFILKLVWCFFFLKLV